MTLIGRLSGLSLPHRDIRRKFSALGVKLEGKANVLKAAPPSWRPDITMAVDLVEEVVRLTGVDHIAPTPLPRLSGVAAPVLTDAQVRAKLVRRLLAARGFVEAVTWSFVPLGEAKLFGGGQPALTLDNPISTELAQMRPSLLPGLISAAKRNRIAAFRTARCSSLARPIGALSRKTNMSPRPGCGSGIRLWKARAVTGRAKRRTPVGRR